MRYTKCKITLLFGCKSRVVNGNVGMKRRVE